MGVGSAGATGGGISDPGRVRRGPWGHPDPHSRRRNDPDTLSRGRFTAVSEEDERWSGRGARAVSLPGRWHPHLGPAAIGSVVGSPVRCDGPLSPTQNSEEGKMAILIYRMLKGEIVEYHR